MSRNREKMRLPSPLRRSVERALRQAKSLAETQDSAMAEEDYNVKTENELAGVPPRAVKETGRCDACSFVHGICPTRKPHFYLYNHNTSTYFLFSYVETPAPL